jgi:hypothetical protein
MSIRARAAAIMRALCNCDQGVEELALFADDILTALSQDVSGTNVPTDVSWTLFAINNGPFYKSIVVAVALPPPAPTALPPAPTQIPVVATPLERRRRGSAAPLATAASPISSAPEVGGPEKEGVADGVQEEHVEMVLK